MQLLALHLTLAAAAAPFAAASVLEDPGNGGAAGVLIRYGPLSPVLPPVLRPTPAPSPRPVPPPRPRQRPTSRALRTPLACETFASDRRLSATLSSTGASGAGAGHVVHVTPDGQVARAEVVDALALALDGGDGFEALVDGDATQHDQLLVLDKDQMEYENNEVAHPDGPFAVRNAFIHSDPETKYRVACPAAGDGAMCQVQDLDGGGAPWFGECVLPADRPVASDACLDAEYEVSLFALQESHFLLGAAGPGGDCPDVVFFAGRDGQRRVRFSPADAADVPAHVVGTASLRAVLAAEARTPDPAAITFDLASNTCLHYAGAISRELGLPEDAGLADFIVENVVARRGGEAVARRLAEEEPALVARDDYLVVGGVDRLPQLLTTAVCSLGIALSVIKDCYSAAAAGSGLPRDIIEKAVYSQMQL